jgi:hypothetical protein
MAETKNNFTGGRMNKDIDDRLIPENEYRNAINLQISKSENSDVGTLQTILGNQLVIDFNNLTESEGLDCIGYFVDTANNRVFLFLTNYTDTNATPQYSVSAKNYIYVYNILQNTSIKLVEGAFLNFSKNAPVIGVNLLEDLLFWTDNRNQPRKINVNRALNSSTYYTIEDQISVAKLSPVYCPEVFKISTLALASTATVGTVSGTGPYTAVITPVAPFSSTLINIGNVVYATAGSSSFTNGTVTAVTTSGLTITSFTVSSDTIFTAGTISLLYGTEPETTMYDVTSEFLPPYGLTATVDGAITATDTFVIDDPITIPYPQAGQIVSGAGIPLGVRVDTYDPMTFTVVVTQDITLADGVEIKFNANPYYNPDFIGDPAYLEDKFVRFSYRYRFDDNEYSIFAPFTQIAYIPKQDGYFLYDNPDSLAEAPVDDETATYRSTIVSFMTNKVNNIFLQIKLPCPANELQSACKISEIDILYKESDGLAVQVVDVIPVSEIAAQAGASDVYIYNYQSRKPFKTLPERDLIRVYDKTPVKALGQEIISNRVVYSNYQDKQGYPKFLNYNVVCNEKAGFNIDANTTSIVEYPNHSVKQNRNYEIGVVLSDKFGRQSGVILSNAISSFNPNFKAASLYVPYKAETFFDSGIPADGIVNQWPGLSFKMLFNEQIGANGITDWPGIYNGDSESAEYNPLGWYSYKVVVKQTEQDYYNVYLPGMMASYPEDPTKELDKTSHFVLIGDNINKVPRDLNDVSGTQEQYRSSVKLYSRVNNIYDPLLPDFYNEQFYPGNTFSFVNTIATLNSLFPGANPITPPPPPEYNQFYQNISNPLIARLSTDTKLGITTTEAGVDEPFKTIRLAVCETNPFNSRLDLYWETSTTGIISELNEAILEGSDAPAAIQDWLFNLPESAGIGYKAVEDFYFSDLIGAPLIIPIGDISFTVQNENGDDKTALFNLAAGAGPGLFNIETTDYFYYGFNANTLDSYTFYITVDTFSPPTTTEFEKLGALSNVTPTITVFPSDPLFKDLNETFVFQFEGNNGSNPLGGKDQDDLAWSIVGGSDEFSINPTTGELTQPSGDIYPGSYSLTIRLTDAGGLYDDFTFVVRYTSETGITWQVTSGGPGIISTGSEPAGYFFSSGTITVEEGITARIRAGSFPSAIDAIVVSDVTITGEGTLIKSANGSGESGFSDLDFELTEGTYSFSIEVNYFFTEGGIGGMFIEPI